MFALIAKASWLLFVIAGGWMIARLVRRIEPPRRRPERLRECRLRFQRFGPCAALRVEYGDKEQTLILTRMPKVRRLWSRSQN